MPHILYFSELVKDFFGQCFKYFNYCNLLTFLTFISFILYLNDIQNQTINTPENFDYYEISQVLKHANYGNNFRNGIFRNEKRTKLCVLFQWVAHCECIKQD